MSRSPQRAPEVVDLKRLRLMIVDDGALVTPPMVRALTEGGFRIEVVADQNYALTDTRGQRYDAIVINSDFAKVDAMWLCRALRVQGCLSVIVVLSDAPSETDQLAAWRAGANDRVGRAIPRDRLVERILAHIDGARIKVAGLLFPVVAELPGPSGVFTMSLLPTVVAMDGRPLALSRIEERLFARLWAAHGAIVPASELIDSAWFGRRVAPSTLQVHLSQLRRKLGKMGVGIERVAKRYRFSSVTNDNVRKKAPAAKAKS